MEIWCLSFYLILWPVWWLQISEARSDYRGRPEDFVSMYLNCIGGEDCHFYYWHIMKTGGTTINSNMRNVFPKNSKKNLVGKKAMEKFKKSVESYCRSKWSSYEVSGKQMRVIVESCMKFNPHSTAIVLFTYREPISRFVSWINMECNKRMNRRSKEIQNFCSVCKYTRETKEFLQKVVDVANDMYLSTPYITNMNFSNVQVLSLETMYLDGFLQSVGRKLNFTVNHANVKKTNICNFGVTAGIISEFAPSGGIYRNLIIEAGITQLSETGQSVSLESTMS